MWPTCEVVFHAQAGISQHNSSSHASNSRPRITTESPTTHPKLTCSVERRVPFLCAVELWSLRLLNERQNQFCRLTYWAVKPRPGRTQVVFRFRFLFSASSPSSWEPCWERHSRLAWQTGPCCCPPSCWLFSLCWIAQRFQASEVAYKWTFRRCQFSKILAETV